MATIITGGTGNNINNLSVSASYASLRGLTVASVDDGRLYQTRGYYADGDGGGGTYIYKYASTAATNGGTVIAPTSGVGRFLLCHSGAVTVKQFGAKGDNATDDTVVLQAAIDAARSEGFKLLGNLGTYIITNTWLIRASCDLSLMSVKADATNVLTAIQVASNTSGVSDTDLDIVLPSLTNSAKVGTGWTNFTSSVGVDCCNANRFRVTAKYIRGFGIGMRVGGTGAGNAYNTYTLGTINDNKIGLLVIPGNLTGWSNQNLFLNGSFSISTSEGTSPISGVIAIQLRRFDPAGNGAPNNNTFIGQSVEGNAWQYQLDIQGTNNVFQNVRYESSYGPRVNLHAVTGNETANNLFLCGYSMDSITWSYSGAGSSNNNSSFGNRNSSTIDASGVALNLRSTTSGGITGPHLQGFNSGTIPLGKTNSATDWTYRLYATGFAFKVNTDANPRAILDQLGKLQLGTGTVATPEGTLRYNYTPAAITSSVNFAPETDNTLSLGAAAYRWSVVYAGTATINTSDREAKQDIAELTVAEKRVATRIKGLVRTYRFRDAVAEKGAEARTHIGVIAQDVVAAFEAEGLDAMKYGLVCRDTWGPIPAELDADGNVVKPGQPAGSRWGIRYDEMLAFIVSTL